VIVGEEAAEAAAWDKLGDQHQTIIGNGEAYEADHVGVIDLAQDGSLLAQLEHTLVVKPVAVEPLDCHLGGA